MSPAECESHASNYIGARINTVSYLSSLFFFFDLLTVNTSSCCLVHFYSTSPSLAIYQPDAFKMVRKAAIPLAVAFSAGLTAAATIDKRIYLGEEAKEGEIPFIVRLHYENPAILCGGSLLDSTTVLTAAHCQPNRVTSVRAGSLVNIPSFYTSY